MKMPRKIKEAFEWLRPIEFLLLAIGVAIAGITYRLEEDERHDRRIIAGWQLLSEEAAGASGKDMALNFLYEQGVLAGKRALFGLNLSFVKHGAPVYLQGLDLYDEDSDSGVYAPMSSFAGAILQGADLRKTKLQHSCFYRTELSKTKLGGADFANADLTYSLLADADMSGAKLTNANLSGAHMKDAKGLVQSQLAEAYYCEAFGKPSLPAGRSVPSRTDCDTSQGCKWSHVMPRPMSEQ